MSITPIHYYFRDKEELSAGEQRRRILWVSFYVHRAIHGSRNQWELCPFPVHTYLVNIFWYRHWWDRCVFFYILCYKFFSDNDNQQQWGGGGSNDPPFKKRMKQFLSLFWRTSLVTRKVRPEESEFVIFQKFKQNGTTDKKRSQPNGWFGIFTVRLVHISTEYEIIVKYFIIDPSYCRIILKFLWCHKFEEPLPLPNENDAIEQLLPL